MLDKGQDAKFYDGYSRWGIKGSNEISEGLSAVYRFEHKFSTEDAGQAGGRLAFVGLDGGFGKLTLGQIWSASYNHAGVIRDIGNYYSDSDTSFRIGNALSYAYSNDVFSVQFDTIMEGGKDSGNAIDQWELGATVNIGDIGKVAFAHVKKEDVKTGNKMVRVTRWINSSEWTYSPKKWSDDEARKTTRESTAFKNGKVMRVVVQPITVYVNLENAGIKANYDAENKQLADKVADDADGNVKLVGSSATDKQLMKVGDGPPATFQLGNVQCATTPPIDKEKCAETTAYKAVLKKNTIKNEAFYFVPGHVEDEMDYGEKSSHVSASFELGAVTLGLGHSTTKSMDPMKTKKAKTNYIGVSGGIGDTGLDWRAWYRTMEAYNDDDMMEKSKPWGIGLGKSLGGGATAYVEHWNDGAKGAKKSGTVVGLRVDF